MENLLEKVSPERQEKLLNPQVSDHYITHLTFNHGYRIYEIKVGRKWVFLKTTYKATHNPRKRISLAKFIILARLNWLDDVRGHALFYNKDKGKMVLPRQWWLNYGFTEKP